MEQFILGAIETVSLEGGAMRVVLDKRYAPALKGLDGLSHVHVLWRFSECDNGRDRSGLEENAPYTGAPAVMGTFATRSPMRPNPIAVSCAGITYIGHDNAVAGLTCVDAHDGTPALDLKPYASGLDRAENPPTPKCCEHWPRSLERSDDFDWGSQFKF